MLQLLRLLEQQNALIGRLITNEFLYLTHCGHRPTQETFTMSVVTTDDNAVRVRPTGLDVDGVKTTPTDLTASIDNPAAAEVIADEGNPGAFLIKRLPATDPSAGALTTVATFTTPGGISASVTVEFDPGTETSLALETELVPSAPVAKTPSDPNPSDPTSPVATP